MTILVLLNKVKDSCFDFTNKLVNYLTLKGNTCLIEDEIINNIPLGHRVTEDLLQKTDFIVVLGGDGTILNSAHIYKEYNLPILGINLGRVGCLAEGNPDNYTQVIDKVLNGDYQIENRVAIEGILSRKNQPSLYFTSFNEVALTRGKRLKMLNVNIKVNQSNDTSFYADGVIVATPTGSSAYSLSAGGPLLIPTSDSFVITPLCAQLKTITSLVVSSNDRISISIFDDSFKESYDSNKAALAIDGRENLALTPDDEIFLYKSTKSLRIIKVNFNSSLYEPIFKVTNTIN
ncbi:MAG: NAD(+)/NADH kinase [Bacilli bacterium]